MTPDPTRKEPTVGDRYVFAKVRDTRGKAINEATIPAPSPEDWQEIVNAVEMGGTPALVALAARAAVRNMRQTPDADVMSRSVGGPPLLDGVNVAPFVLREAPDD